MSDKFVAILMGSDADLPVMQTTYDTLKKLGIKSEMKITSAHRTPAATHEFVKDAEARGCQLFICAASLSAHLAGVVAGLTTRPVIGVPMDGGPLQGEDALLSTVQMPSGVPVATVTIGKVGAKNAAYLAAQIFALFDEAVDQAIRADREANTQAVLQKDRDLQTKLNG